MNKRLRKKLLKKECEITGIDLFVKNVEQNKIIEINISKDGEHVIQLVICTW